MTSSKHEEAIGRDYLTNSASGDEIGESRT